MWELLLFVWELLSFVWKTLKRPFKWLWNKGKSRLAKREQRRQIAERIKRLDAHEQRVLREFEVQNRNTVLLPVGDPAVEGLLNVGIIEKVGSQKTRKVGPVCSYETTDDAKDRLTLPRLGVPDKYIVYNEGTEPTVTSEGKEWLLRNRPDFIDDIDRPHSRIAVS